MIRSQSRIKIIIKTVHFEPELGCTVCSGIPVQFKPKWGVQFAPELPVQFKPEWGVQFAPEYPIKNLQPNSKIKINLNGVHLELKKGNTRIKVKPKINLYIRIFLFISISIIVFHLIGFVLISFGKIISYNIDNQDNTVTSFSRVGIVMQWSRDFWFIFLAITLVISNMVLKRGICYFYNKKYPLQMDEIFNLINKNTT